jgi:hypothetical protein
MYVCQLLKSDGVVDSFQQKVEASGVRNNVAFIPTFYLTDPPFFSYIHMYSDPYSLPLSLYSDTITDTVCLRLALADPGNKHTNIIPVLCPILILAPLLLGRLLKRWYTRCIPQEEIGKYRRDEPNVSILGRSDGCREQRWAKLE